MARSMPRARGFDHTYAFLREGYDFISNRCAALGSNVFRARLMLRKVTCMRGASAAEVFYGSDRFTRRGAMPLTVLMLLQDFGSVQMLDGKAHRHRKAMFTVIGRPQAADDLATQFTEEWRRTVPRWSRMQSIILFTELEELLTRTGASWAGVPMSEDDLKQRTREYSEMLAATGSFGPRTLRALLLRRRTERWAQGVIRRARSGKIECRPDSALALIATHLDADGRPLSVKIAAIELINVLRAVVAVARFIVFAAKALHEHPRARAQIAGGDQAYLGRFADETRRTAPFFPVIGGRVCESFTWQGMDFSKGDWVLLDLYGTNRDPCTWDSPDRFDPDRFLRKHPTPFELVPQGAGDPAVTHRCPGEHLTLALIRAAARELAGMTFRVPAQDLSVSRTRIPTLPASGFVMADIRPAAAARTQAAE
jgi:fatty-acid peroxygenase